MKTQVRNTGKVDHPVTLDDGSVLGVGQEGKCDLSKPHNAALLEDGHITEVLEKQEKLSEEPKKNDKPKGGSAS